MNRYLKLAVAVAGAVIIVLQSALRDGQVSDVEYIQMVMAGLTVISTWLVANVPGIAAYTKSIMAGLVAVASLLTAYIVAGPITGAQWVNIVVAFATAAGVLLVPNRAQPTTTGAY